MIDILSVSYLYPDPGRCPALCTPQVGEQLLKYSLPTTESRSKYDKPSGSGEYGGGAKQLLFLSSKTPLLSSLP